MVSNKNNTEIILYTTPEGNIKIDTVFQNETIWLTQKKMAELFDVQRPAITMHLKNIYESGELDENVVSSILEHTTQHGAIKGKTQTKPVKYYNLDTIIAVGYRVNSKRATQFRIWDSSPGKVKADVAKITSETRYEEFDQKRKKKEAIEADNEDIKALEEFEKRLVDRNR